MTIKSLTLVLASESRGTTQTRSTTTPLTLLALTEAARLMIDGTPTATGERIVSLRASA